MTQRTYALAALLAAALAAPAAAKTPAAGEALILGVDPRSLGLAEAYTAQARGEVGSLARSPLGLHGLKEGAMAFSHAFLAAQMSATHFAYGRNLGSFSIGLSVVRLDYGKLEQRDAGNALLGSFSPSDTVYQVSLARAFGAWEAGVTLKRLESKIVKTAGAFAVDAALRTRVGDGVSVAATVRNLGQELKFENEGFKLPTEVAAGVSWAVSHGLSWNAEAVEPLHADLWVATGLQWEVAATAKTRLALRGGVNTRTPELGKLAGVHAGFGVDAGPVGLDYSYDPFGDIGTTHRVGVRYQW